MSLYKKITGKEPITSEMEELACETLKDGFQSDKLEHRLNSFSIFAKLAIADERNEIVERSKKQVDYLEDKFKNIDANILFQHTINKIEETKKIGTE